MKNKMTNNDVLDIHNDEQYENEVFMTLDDNGDWEYTRLGFGEDHVGLYVVDLDDSGERFREKLYVNDKFSVQDVLAEGVACGLFEKYEDGDLRGTHGVKVDDDVQGNEWGTFLTRVMA